MEPVHRGTKAVHIAASLPILLLSVLLMGQRLNPANGLIPTESERFFEEGREDFEQEVQHLLDEPCALDQPWLEIDEAVYREKEDRREIENADPPSTNSLSTNPGLRSPEQS